MKKIIALLIIIAFVTGAVPAFAAEAAKAKGAKSSAAGTKAVAREKTIFQITKDSIDKPVEISEKDKLKPFGEFNIFQSTSNAIKEGSAKARNLSLRGNK